MTTEARTCVICREPAAPPRNDIFDRYCEEHRERMLALDSQTDEDKIVELFASLDDHQRAQLIDLAQQLRKLNECIADAESLP